MFRGKVFNSRVCRLVYFFLFCRSKRSNVRGQINRETDRTAGIEFSELFDTWLDLVDEVFRKQLFFLLSSVFAYFFDGLS